MRPLRNRNGTHLTAFSLALLLHLGLIGGCATSHGPATRQQTIETPVVRYGRYTLVELTPDDGQQDLMRQVVDLTIPDAADTSVGEALRYLLLRSGYRLCDDREELAAFDELPLPAAHVRIGPMMLRDVLQMLAGSAWMLEVDETARKVCFTPRRPS